MLSAVVVQLAATCIAAGAVQVRSASFSCDAGPYAIVLPRHYPTLLVIGRNKITDLESRTVGATTITTRRIEHIGLRMDVTISSAEPNAYKLSSLDVYSLRWNVGPLSVGRNPWRSINDPALDGVKQDGTVELLGSRDSAVLLVRSGRIDKVSYRCPGPAAR